jgi:molybdate transport system substrate-binding protein
MSTIKLLSGGAAHGLVSRLEPELLAATGCRIDGVFSAVGGLKTRLLAGERADIAILTAAIIAELEDKGVAMRGLSQPVGSVATAVAVRAGDPHPSIATPDALRATLLAASAIYYPDPEQATAGIHFANVLRRLGIHDATAARHRTYPNGATAMAALAASSDVRPIGCTQLTEIISTSSIEAIGDLPGDLGLVTIYTAAVLTTINQHAATEWLMAALADPARSSLRRACGFV